MPNPPKMLTANGKTQTLKQWSAETGIPVKTICSRMELLGWTPDRAVSVRPDRRFRRGGRPRGGVPRPVPTLREDGKGGAFCRWRQYGRDHYRSFGPWGTDEANAAYRRFAAEWAAGGYDAAPATRGSAGAFVGEIIAGWIEHARREYRKLGKLTAEYHRSRAAGEKLNDLYGDTLAAEFGPAQFRAIRQVWIDAGLARSTVNNYAYSVLRCFAWAAGQSLVPASVPAALACVEKLKRGRSDAPDLEPREPVADDVVAATLAALPATPRGRTVAGMVRVQRLAGLRPQHITEMRVGDLDRTGDVWRYTPSPAGTKTLHIGKRPAFYFGPRAQAAIAPFLVAKSGEDYVFTWTRAGKVPRVWRLSRDRYAKMVREACEAAGVKAWTPHQLRHALATEVAARFASLEHAAAAIGDSPATAAAVYVHVNPRERAAIEVAKAMG